MEIPGEVEEHNVNCAAWATLTPNWDQTLLQSQLSFFFYLLRHSCENFLKPILITEDTAIKGS